MSKNARQFALSQSWNAVFEQLLMDYEHVINEEKLALFA